MAASGTFGTGVDETVADAGMAATGQRDYAGLRARLIEATRGVADRAELMRRSVELLWETLGSAGVSWVGFYEISADGSEMTLAAREPKPACSPIGLHGVCGRAFTERRAIVVGDVSSLGEGYIACDPLDRSELVLPLFAAETSVEAGSPIAWGVLDLDSSEADAFGPADIVGLRDAMLAAGLTVALPEGLSMLAI
ncbi:MAG: GAF domain-containing protein [Planctomycetota bacterium]